MTQEELADRGPGESSGAVRNRVAAARARQLERQGKSNVLLSGREVDRYCAPEARGAQVLKQATARLGLSARGYHRVLKAARSIADLEGSTDVAASHVAEAIQYRRFERTP